MAEPPSSPLPRPLADGIVPEEIVSRTENRWLMVMAAMLVVINRRARWARRLLQSG